MTKQALAAAFIALFLACLADPTSAQVIITQAKANAGNVTPGDAAGFPVTISQPGSYRLATNLGVPAGKNGIEITTHDVTIDFNGFRMQGYLVGNDGVRGGSVDTGTVKNGVIAGFKGVAIAGRDFWTVERMSVLVNAVSTTGIHTAIELGNAGRVFSSTIASNKYYGITCRTGCLIESNIIQRNGSFGLILASGTVLGNTINSNGRYGIARWYGAEAIGYGNNTLFGNNNGGSQVEASITRLQPNACTPAC